VREDVFQPVGEGAPLGRVFILRNLDAEIEPILAGFRARLLGLRLTRRTQDQSPSFRSSSPASSGLTRPITSPNGPLYLPQQQGAIPAIGMG
jgi:hypothetical protein